MDQIFSTHGIPRVIQSDNGPPFTSEDIKVFMQENGINHQKITPLWPQANSEAENFMKNLTKAIRSANTEGKNWKRHLSQFLLNYRATPHSTTGFAPAELLFGRKIQTKLPQLSSVSDQSEIQLKVQQNDDKAKTKMKEYADKNSKAKASDIDIDDFILIRQRKQNKLSTKFDPSPFQVVRRKGTMVTAVRKGRYMTRNTSHCKRVDPSLMVDAEDEDEDKDEDEDEDIPNNPDQEPQDNANEVPARNANKPRHYPTRNRGPFRRYGQNSYEQH